MKNIYIVLFIFSFGAIYAQDTTSFRMIGVSSNSDMDYFANDSTSLGSISTTNNGSFHMIAQDLQDGKVYVLADSVSEGGYRDLYVCNPLTGDLTMVKDLDTSHYNTGDLASDGSFYFTVGNGNSANAGKIFKYNPADGSETFVGQSAVSNSRALEIDGSTGKLHIYEGFDDNLYIYDLNTLTESQTTYTSLDDEIHGAYYSDADDLFFLSAYGGELYVGNDATDTSFAFYHDTDDGVSGNNIMDLSVINLLSNPAEDGFCPGDSLMIKGYFDGVTYAWYKNGVEMTSDGSESYYASTPGIYKALVEITMDQQVIYMWSESIEVVQYSMPNVNITQADNDNLICPNETIVLNGANGGTLQWFKDGAAIAGANQNSYSAMGPGAYNQKKTNMSGCSAMASSDYVITVDPNCNTGISEEFQTYIDLFPNPVQGTLEIRSNETDLAFIIYNGLGKKVYVGKLSEHSSVDLHFLDEGIYYISAGNTMKRFIKL